MWDDVKQTTTKTYYHNQQLKTLTTKDRGGAVVESHDLAYTDTGGNYVGDRTRDEFLLDHPNSTACAATTCTARWAYDPRGRLIGHQDGHGGTTTYTLDPAGNITEQTTPQGTTTRSYTGNRLTTATTGGQTFDYFYDPLGNLDCITTGPGTHGSCNPAEGASVPAELITDHSDDYLDRLTTTRSYNAGTLTDSADYVYDALDRVVKETDNHPTKNLSRTTDFTYQGLTTQLAQEQISTDKADRTEDETKTYLYDVLGRRITMHHQKDTTLDGGGTTSEDARYTYGHDPQASVSLLLDDGTGSQGPNAASVKATYGYTPYGQADDTLTKGDTQQLQPINPFRFIGKYHDPGTGSVDMGARRYTPNLGRFFQQDRYHGALANLSLTLDPLTANRYAYAAGRPVGYVEIDGHCFGRDHGDLCPTEDIDKQWQADPIPKDTSSGGGGGGSSSGGGGDSGASAGSRDLPDVQRCPPTPEPTCLPNPTHVSPTEQRIGEAALSYLYLPIDIVITTATDTRDCATEGDKTACAWTAAIVLPFLKPVRAALRSARLSQDVNVSAVAPRPMGTNRSIGRLSHNRALQQDLAALPRGAANIRVNQQQVNAAGQRVGINRPDLQYTLDGRRYYVEYEAVANPRGAAHRARILANDPTGVFNLRIVP